MIDDAALVALLESCGQPSWIYDAATLDLLDVNDAAVDLFECRRDALLRSKVTDLLADLHQHFNGGETPLSEGADGASQRLCLKTRRGRRFPAHVKDFPISRSGRPARIAIAYPASRALQPDTLAAQELSVRSDIEANRPSISQRLVRADAALAAAANLMKFAIWELNLEIGALSWSASLYDLIDAAPEDLEPTLEGYFSRLHPEDRDATILRFENFMAAQDEYLDFAHRLIKRDGSLLHVRGSARRTSIDGQDWLVGMVMDDTARSRNEAVLADARALLKIAGVSAQFGGWKFDVRKMHFKWSMGASETLDWFSTSISTAEETIALFPVEYRPRAEQLLGEAIKNAKDFDELLPVERPDGQKFWLRVCGIPTTDDNGRVTDIVGSFQDVTSLIRERDRAAELASKLVNTLEEMSDAFYLLDHQLCFVYVNTKAMELADRAQSEILGQNIWHAFPDVAKMEVRPKFEAAIKEQKGVEFTYFHEGWREWFRVHATPVSEGLAVYFRDVTSEYEEAQRLALLESAIARQNDLVLIFDVDEEGNRTVAYTNNAFTRKLGYRPDEVKGRPPVIFYSQNAGENQIARVRSYIDQGVSFRSEVLFASKTGEDLWLEANASPIDNDARHITHWVVVLRDVTLRRKVDSELRERLKEMRSLYSVLAILADDGLSEHQVYQRVAELVARAMMFDPHAIATIRIGDKEYRSRKRGETSVSIAEPIIAAGKKIGEVAVGYMNAGPLVSGQTTPFLLEEREMLRAVATHLGQMIARRQTAGILAQNERMNAIGHLTGGIAHDFNNLLTVIIGNSQALADHLDESSDYRQLAEMTAMAAQRGAELTSRLLSFARRQPLDPQNINCNDLIVDLAPLFRRAVSERIGIYVDVADDLWTARADLSQLESAVLNLVVNARDAMSDAGKIVLMTKNLAIGDYNSHPDLGPGEYVSIAVSDTGTGIPEEILKYVFEPFFTTKEPGKGSGLGLSMIYGFARQSGGTVRINTTVGAGTTVEILLPRGGAIERGGNRFATPKEDSRANEGAPEKILVVEDDNLMRDHAVSVLKGLGYEVHSASHAEEALASLEGASFDLVFTDIVMPGNMNGIELAAQIRRQWPSTRVLLTTGYFDEAEGESPGAAILRKPYRGHEMAAAVRSAMGGA